MKLHLGRRSILVQLGGLALVAVLAAQAVSATVFVLTPRPAPQTMTVAAAAAALRSPAAARQADLVLSKASRVPAQGSDFRSRAVADALAESLNVPSADVRALSLSASAASGAPTISLKTPERTAQVVAIGGETTAAEGVAVQVMLRPDFEQPAFQAALRVEPGRWAVVRPDDRSALLWRARILGAFALTLLMLAPVIWLAARRLTQPMRALAETAARAGIGGEPTRFFAEGSSEVAEVTRALNAMQKRINEQASQQTRMLAAVAHDLRTPLTGLRIRAESAPPAERDAMAADIRRMEAMIGQVLNFAACGQGGAPRECIDLAALACEAAADARLRGGDVTYEARDTPLVQGAPVSLHRAISNLIDNALRYAGAAQVTVEADHRGCAVHVADAGPGIPEAEIHRVVDPFYRLESSRNLSTGGVGLGLSIASAIARDHGGDIELRNREAGGLIATIRLPPK